LETNDIQLTWEGAWQPGLQGQLHLAGSTPRGALRAIFDTVPVPLIWISLDNGTFAVNRSFQETYSWQRPSTGRWPSLIRRIIDPKMRQCLLRLWRMQAALVAARADGTSLPIDEVEFALFDGKGHERTVLHRGTLAPAPRIAIASFVDITERKRNEEQAARAEKLLREREILYPVLLELTQEMILLTEADGRRSFVSPAVLPLTGWTQEEYLALRTETTTHPDDLSNVLAVRRRCLSGSTSERMLYRTLRKDGSWLWIEATAGCYRDPGTQEVVGYVATLRDSTERKAEEAKHAEREALLEQQARFDHLTRVANRHVFHTALSDEARRHTRRTQSVSLLLVDIDHFKLFNDRYGHLEGDRVLRQVADILKFTASRVSDLVARFGGEEFVLLLPMTSESGAHILAEKILTAVRAKAIPHLGSSFGILTVSIGIACCPADQVLDRDEFLLTADKALYAAKKRGRNCYALSGCVSPSTPGLAGPPHPELASA
jgi:diguanylate cyclase (GGDEF)-like protein/PAS domain S-box-containing protein